VPKFPTPEGQDIENWQKVFKKYEGKLGTGTILIGHSVGAAFALSVIENMQAQAKAAYLVSGFRGNLGNPKFDDLNRSFTQKAFNWQKIRANCKEFHVIASDNDPYVPLEKAQDLADNLDAKMEIVKGAGHFNALARYDRFEYLLEKIKKIDDAAASSR
ncbi:MAG TPA: alpha/beta hydrolase, partial [Candidatus Micrarchaeota archaeon]|nr:alpha/beta hydrolase [Candidatus Micrarchaeota archaeon]